MNQRAVRTIVSAGLAGATLVLSFLGCNRDYGDLKGNCQVADAGPNDCTIAKCSADGTPAPEPVPNAEKRVCFRGENEGMCVDGECALICETQMVPCKCASDSACPDDKVCIDWSCDMAGECKSTLTADGTLIDPLETGDCLKSVCQGGTPKSVPDMDPPPDTVGDCQKPVCSDGSPGAEPDDTDEPDDTGCVNNACANGTVVSMNAAVGTTCTGGACNAMGACVDCLSQADWTTCGGTLCIVKKCTSEACTLGSECDSAACTDGFCCNTACTEECRSCKVTNSVGTCANIPFNQSDASYIDPVFMTTAACDNTSGSICNGSGKCLKTIGKPCNANAECLSNNCLMPQKVCLGAIGETCTSAGSCASGKCTAGACE